MLQFEQSHSFSDDDMALLELIHWRPALLLNAFRSGKLQAKNGSYLVTLHGGTIVAESDGPGKGACFTVTLPPAS